MIAYVLNNLPGFLLVISLICAAIPAKRPAVERFLNWVLLLPIGVGTLWAAVFHLAFPALAAHYIGWQNSPFQFEVGTADLAFGILGVAAFWSSIGFKTATVLAIAIFLLGDAAGHVAPDAGNGQFCARKCRAGFLYGYPAAIAFGRPATGGTERKIRFQEIEIGSRYATTGAERRTAPGGDESGWAPAPRPAFNVGPGTRHARRVDQRGRFSYRLCCYRSCS